MATYDNQPTADQVHEKLRKEGWSQSRIDAAELATFVGDRRSKAGRAYEVMVLGVVESGTLTMAYAQAQSGRVYAEKDKGALRRHTENTFTGNGSAPAPAPAAAPRSAPAPANPDHEILLDDLVTAMLDGLNRYPRQRGVLEYFERKGQGSSQRRYPSEKGVGYLVKHGVPLAFNPLHVSDWTDADQTRLEEAHAPQETILDETTDETQQADDAPEIADSDVSSRFLMVKDLLAGVGTSDFHESAKALLNRILGDWIATGEWDEKHNGPHPETWEKIVPKVETEDRPQEDPQASKPVSIEDLEEGEDTEDAKPQDRDGDTLDLADSILAEDDDDAAALQAEPPVEPEVEIDKEPVEEQAEERPNRRRAISVTD